MVAFGFGIGGERPSLWSFGHCLWHAAVVSGAPLGTPACTLQVWHMFLRGLPKNWEVLSLGPALVSQANNLRNLGCLQFSRKENELQYSYWRLFTSLVGLHRSNKIKNLKKAIKFQLLLNYTEPDSNQWLNLLFCSGVQLKDWFRQDMSSFHQEINNPDMDPVPPVSSLMHP